MAEAAHPHTEAYREARHALARGDIAGFLEWVAEDVAWWEIGASAPIVGRSVLGAHLAAPSSIRSTEEVHDLLANDEHLVALIHATIERSDENLDLSWAEIHHFDDDGRVAKRQTFPSDIAKALKVADWRAVG